MQVLPRGISNDEINHWVDQPEHDARTWTLKSGAPANVVSAFPQLVASMLTPDVVDLTQPRVRRSFDENLPQSVDMTNPSTMFVRAWQFARDARRLYDEAAAIGLDKPFADRLEAHAVELELLRDQIHDALLTDDDRAAGAEPRI